MKLFTLITTLLAASVTSLSAEEAKKQTPLGFEAVTGMRSTYIQRGFEQADQVLDFQLEGEVSLSNSLFLGYGAWFVTATGQGDFTESGLKATLTKELDEWRWSGGTEFKELENSELESGLYFSSELTYFFADSNDYSHHATAILGYDTGANGFYTALEYGSYYAINRDSYLSFRLGVSAVDNYYDSSGINDAYSRLSYTYNLTDQVSISPFAEASVILSDREQNDQIVGGIWFEVSF